MDNKDKIIEEMAKVIAIDRYNNVSSLDPATMLYDDLGYRKITDSVVLSREELEDKVIITKKEYDKLKYTFNCGYPVYKQGLEEGSKETAEKILDFIQENRHKYEMWYLVSELRKFFGIEQNNDWVFGDLADELNNKFGVEIKE